MNGLRHYIPTPEVFDGYGYNWNEIITVSSSEVNAYPKASLVKLADDPRVYVIDTDKGSRRHLPTPQVFESYGYNWDQIITISQLEMDAYKQSNLIKTQGSDKVYYLKDNQRHHIISTQAFEANGFSWREIMEVNNTELESYEQGPSLTT